MTIIVNTGQDAYEFMADHGCANKDEHYKELVSTGSTKFRFCGCTYKIRKGW